MNTVRAAVAYGSNLADRPRNIARALDALSRHSRIRVLRQSSTIETDPVGGPPQGRFLNGVVLIETDLKAPELLALLHRIEADGGRQREQRNEPREIDLDLILYGNEVTVDAACRIPHPRMHEREFVLQPLAEIAPEWVHPELGQTIEQLYAAWRESNHHGNCS